MSMAGTLGVRKIGATKAPLSWRIRNALRWGFITGWLFNRLAYVFSKVTGIVTMTSDLAIRVRRGATGEWIDYGTVGYRVVTDAGVAYIVDDWDGGSNTIDLFNYHGCGTGNTAEAVGDTALVTESTTALNPDSTRATGTKSQPAANQMRSVGTLTFDNTVAVVEHGIFHQAATGGGTLLDRTVFSTVNVVSGDSIQFTYTLTLNSGG
jgi:hypothetical protein